MEAFSQTIEWFVDVLAESYGMVLGIVGTLVTFVCLWGGWKLLTRRGALPVSLKSSAPLEAQHTRSSKSRVRKRDRIRFQMERLRRMGVELTKDPVQRRELFERLVKKVRGQHDEDTPTALLRRRKLPDNFLEPNFQEEDSQLPDEILLMLRSIRVFGHIERFSFMKLAKYIETVSLRKDEHLFKVGDLDDNIYVVLRGRLRVFITEDSVEHTIHDVGKGDNIHSLLSVLDVVTGYPRPYRTVSARALQPSEVLRVPARAFIEIFEGNPASMVRLVQVIAVRLQRVTFLALHNYLGLSSELMSRERQASSNSAVVRLQSYLQERNNHAHVAPAQLVSRSVSRDDSVNNAPTSPRRTLSDPAGDDFRARPRSRSSSPHGAARIPRGLFPDFEAAEARAMSGSHEVELGEMHGRVSGSARRRLMRANNARLPHSHPQPPPMLQLDDEIVMQSVLSDLAQILGLENAELLEDKVTLTCVSAGTVLVKQGAWDTDLFFVVSGQLNVVQEMIGSRQLTSMFRARPGEMADFLAVLTGEPAFFTIHADTTSHIATISRRDFYTLLRQEPRVMLNSAHLLLRRMSYFVRQIDFALDWISIDAGKALYSQGDPSDSVYIVVNGRLRQVCMHADGHKSLVGEYGRSEWLGFLEVLTHTSRATTVYAIRDSELARIPADLLNYIKRKQPQVVTRLIQLLSNKLLNHLKGSSGHGHSIVESVVGAPDASRAGSGTSSNLRAVAILPANERVPLEAFTLELQHSLTAIGSSLRLTSNIVRRYLGDKALDSMNDFRLTSWLAQQEDMHDMILYQCDTTPSVWNKRCIRQADRVLVVGRAEDPPTPLGRLESVLGDESIKVAKTLVLLHRETTEYPPVGRTAAWLNARDWCTFHLHVRAPDRLFKMRTAQKHEEHYTRINRLETPSVHSDMARLARVLTGRAVGLVLGGGGARGCSHVGVIRALREAGIPIDMVGGTSIGAFMGALYAEETRIPQFQERACRFAHDMTSLWKRVIDLTYPITSFFSGKSFNAGIYEVFKNRCIEDLWLPYFCVTTDITNSKMKVHTSGSTWRYVRASMSLSGYLPPLCDPEDGALLLDGGYVNNLPADIMQSSMGAAYVFAVDVGSQDETDLTNYGDVLSGWWLLWKRLNPWATPVKVPNQQEIQSRLAYVSCVRQLEEVKRSGICRYMRPPVDAYGTLQFGSFQVICDVGYAYCKKFVAEWRGGGPNVPDDWAALLRYTNPVEKRAEDNVLLAPTAQAASVAAAAAFASTSVMSSSLSALEIISDCGAPSLSHEQLSFTDLAEMVSRIDPIDKTSRSQANDMEEHVVFTDPVFDSEMDEVELNYESDCTEYTRPMDAVHRRGCDIPRKKKVTFDFDYHPSQSDVEFRSSTKRDIIETLDLHEISHSA